MAPWHNQSGGTTRSMLPPLQRDCLCPPPRPFRCAPCSDCWRTAPRSTGAWKPRQSTMARSRVVSWPCGRPRPGRRRWVRLPMAVSCTRGCALCEMMAAQRSWVDSLSCGGRRALFLATLGWLVEQPPFPRHSQRLLRLLLRSILLMPSRLPLLLLLPLPPPPLLQQPPMRLAHADVLPPCVRVLPISVSALPSAADQACRRASHHGRVASWRRPARRRASRLAPRPPRSRAQARRPHAPRRRYDPRDGGPLRHARCKRAIQVGAAALCCGGQPSQASCCACPG